MDKLFQKYRKIIIYGLISVFVTFVDVIVCRLLDRRIGAVGANTCGVVVGFFLHYFFSSKLVFNRRDKTGFVIYVATSLLGLALADFIVYSVRLLFDSSGASYSVAFYSAKAASIVIPFFIMYFLRKYLFRRIKTK